MDTVQHMARGAGNWLKRLWPLLLLLGVGGFIVAMGWHRYLTLEHLANNRESLRNLIEGHYLLALTAFVAIYAVTGWLIALERFQPAPPPSWACWARARSWSTRYDSHDGR